MERCDCILLSLLRGLLPLQPCDITVDLGIIGSSKYRGSAVFFCCVDVRCRCSADSSTLSLFLQHFLPTLQIDDLLTAFIRDHIAPELRVLAQPIDSLSLYYDTCGTQSYDVGVGDADSGLALQVIVPTRDADLREEMDMFSVFASCNAEIWTALEVNSMEVEHPMGGRVMSFTHPSGDRVYCSYDDSSALSDPLLISLSVACSGVPLRASDPLFSLLSSHLILDSRNVFSKPAKSVQKSEYREVLSAAGVKTCVGCFYVTVDVRNPAELGDVMKWAFCNVRGVLMTGIIAEGDFEHYFIESFARTAASLVSHIYSRGGRIELDSLFPEPMDTQTMGDAILREAQAIL